MVLEAFSLTHQDGYEAVATPVRATFHCNEDMSFPPIRADFNGPLARSRYYIAGARHDEEVRCGAGGILFDSSGRLRGCSNVGKGNIPLRRR